MAVPTYFYKVIFGEKENNSERVGTKIAIRVFILPNATIKDDKNLKEFEVEFNIVERASGLEFTQDLKVSYRKRLCEEVK